MDNISEDQYQVLCMSLVLPSLWITPVKISISGLMYVTGVTVLPSLWVTSMQISILGLMYVTGVTVTGVTFLMDKTSEDPYIRSYVFHWCYCHWCYHPYG